MMMMSIGKSCLLKMALVYIVGMILVWTLWSMQTTPGIILNQGRIDSWNDRVIKVADTNHHTAKTAGCVFHMKGCTGVVSVSLRTSLLHSYSPWVEETSLKRFVGYKGEHRILANSPAMYFQDGVYHVVFRLWLQNERFSWGKEYQRPSNWFQDNYLYSVRYDRNFKPLDEGILFGIPSPKWQIGDGPIEPRLFKFKDRLFVSYNTGYFSAPGKNIDFTIIIDYQTQKVITPVIKGGSLVERMNTTGMRRDKHWIPLVAREKLYFIYTFDPLRVMECNIDFHCEYVQLEEPRRKMQFSPLRGGTPFVLYKWPYYVSVTHSTLWRKMRTGHKRFYTAHITVMAVEPFRVVYLSEPLQFDDELLSSVPIARKRYIARPFLFPVGIHLEDQDNMDIGVHINDYSSVLLRIKGISGLMEKVISIDKKGQASFKGGPLPSLVEKYLKESTANSTGLRLFSLKT